MNGNKVYQLRDDVKNFRIIYHYPSKIGVSGDDVPFGFQQHLGNRLPFGESGKRRPPSRTTRTGGAWGTGNVFAE